MVSTGADAAVQPVLKILSPQSGATVTPPWAVRYAVTGLTVSPAHPLAIRVALVGQSGTMRLKATRASGVVEVPDDRFWSGRRDVVFTLLHPNGAPYANKGASHTVTSLIIAGSR